MKKQGWLIVGALVLAGVGVAFWGGGPSDAKPDSSTPTQPTLASDTETSSPTVAAPELPAHLTREILDTSLDLGRYNLMANQRDDGAFNYRFHLTRMKTLPGASQVRQAGGLWSLALIHQDMPSEQTGGAIRCGFGFYEKYSTGHPEGGRYIVLRDQLDGSTGTMALVVLAHIDYLLSETFPDRKAKYAKDLQDYMKCLLRLRRSDGHFYANYSYDNGNPSGEPSPYADGEALLAMVKAARYSGYTKLKPYILQSAETMYRDHVFKALEKDPDSDTTKGFYQWATMAFYELYKSGWDDVEKYALRGVELGHWMVDVHKTLERTRNTAYACEGLIYARELARLLGDTKAMEKFDAVIDQSLLKLTTWQVGHPLQNGYLRLYNVQDRKALGAVMNERNDPVLRIDVTQHQMHAVVLARKFIYKKEPAAAKEAVVAEEEDTKD